MAQEYIAIRQRTKRELFWSRFITCCLLFITLATVFFLGFWVGDYTPIPHQKSFSVNLPNHIIHSEQDFAFAQNDFVDFTNSSNWKYQSFKEEVRCLAENIYFEANNQQQKGQIAVALVTLNRVKSDYYPNSICDVVWQKKQNPKTKKMVAQFSWTMDGKPDIPVSKNQWRQAVRIAEAILAERTLTSFYDFTHGSTHYHANYVSPFWTKHFTHTVALGDHVFYRDEKRSPVASHGTTTL